MTDSTAKPRMPQTYAVALDEDMLPCVEPDADGDLYKVADVHACLTAQQQQIEKLLRQQTTLQQMREQWNANVDRFVLADAQRDRLVELLRRTMTDTACVEADGPGCWFCDRDDGTHADDCEAANALEEIGRESRELLSRIGEAAVHD